MSTLLQISKDAEALEDLLDEYAEAHDGDITDIADVIDAWLVENTDDLKVKLDGYVSLILECEARAKARKEESKRVAELAKYDVNLAARLKERIKYFFEQHDLTRVDTTCARITLAKNGGKLPLIVDGTVPPEQLPQRFQKVSLSADNAAIRDALESGEELEFARLGERGKSIRIK